MREAEEILAGSPENPQPTKLQREYILTSQRNEVRQRRRLTIGLSFGLITVTILAIIAWGLRNPANEERSAHATAQKEAEIQSTVAITAATADRRADKALSMLLADDAKKVSDDGDTILALPLILAANAIQDPPTKSQRILSEIAYATTSRNRSPTSTW